MVQLHSLFVCLYVRRYYIGLSHCCKEGIITINLGSKQEMKIDNESRKYMAVPFTYNYMSENNRNHQSIVPTENVFISFSILYRFTIVNLIGCHFTGVRPVDFVGNFYMSNTTDVEMAIVDSDKTFCCEIKHDDKLNENDGVYIQVW